MMVLPIRPLGDYWQLLQKHGLLSSDKPLPAELLSRPVHLVSCDSQAVEPGTLFIVKGAHFRGRYLADALEKGAFVYLSDHVWEEAGAAPCLLVRDVRRAMALLADFYYDHPSGKLSVVGITGTKGKSSTTYYLKYIFDEYLSAWSGSNPTSPRRSPWTWSAILPTPYPPAWSTSPWRSPARP